MVEERASFYKKTCGLEKSAVIVYSCANNDKSSKALEEYIIHKNHIDNTRISLQKQLLVLSSIQYKEKERKAKKKKTKAYTKATTTSSPAIPLQYWNIRYDTKAAFFSELRSDHEGALK